MPIPTGALDCGELYLNGNDVSRSFTALKDFFSAVAQLQVMSFPTTCVCGCKNWRHVVGIYKLCQKDFSSCTLIANILAPGCVPKLSGTLTSCPAAYSSDWLPFLFHKQFYLRAYHPVSPRNAEFGQQMKFHNECIDWLSQLPESALKLEPLYSFDGVRL